MPDQTLDQIAPGGVVKLDDAPAGFDDATFDALFPADGVSHTAAPQVTQTETPAATTQTQTQTTTTESVTDTEFLKGSKSVYKTKEAALEGLNQKDTLIDTLRERYALVTGIDPITGQPLSPTVAPQAINYSQNPKQYMQDLYKAAEKGPEAYAAVQKKFLMDSLGPALPVIHNSARQEAVNTVSKDIKDFGTFIGSEDYTKALDTVPELKNAISTAESNMEFSGQLPGLYRAAYLIGKGLQVPKIVAAAASQQTQTTAPTKPAVPSVTPRTATLPSPTTQKSNFKSIDGIKATIAEMEAKGLSLDF